MGLSGSDQKSLPTFEQEEMGASAAARGVWALSDLGLVKQDNWQAACQQLRPLSLAAGKILQCPTIVKSPKNLEKYQKSTEIVLSLILENLFPNIYPSLPSP